MSRMNASTSSSGSGCLNAAKVQEVPIALTWRR
jgi:hypothetical protein